MRLVKKKIVQNISEKMENFTIDSNISISDDHIGLDESQDYYDLENNNDTTQLNITLDYCKVSPEKYLYLKILKIFLQEHLKIIREYDPYTATVCAIYFVFGVVCAFFGYRCFKAIMFLYGFIFGSIVVYLICVEEKVLPGMNIIKVILIEK